MRRSQQLSSPIAATPLTTSLLVIAIIVPDRRPTRCLAMIADSVLPVRPRRRRQPRPPAGAVVAGVAAFAMFVATIVLLATGH